MPTDKLVRCDARFKLRQALFLPQHFPRTRRGTPSRCDFEAIPNERRDAAVEVMRWGGAGNDESVKR